MRAHVRPSDCFSGIASPPWLKKVRMLKWKQPRMRGLETGPSPKGNLHQGGYGEVHHVLNA